MVISLLALKILSIITGVTNLHQFKFKMFLRHVFLHRNVYVVHACMMTKSTSFVPALEWEAISWIKILWKHFWCYKSKYFIFSKSCHCPICHCLTDNVLFNSLNKCICRFKKVDNKIRQNIRQMHNQVDIRFITCRILLSKNHPRYSFMTHPFILV